jgi:hypothetical protein
MSSNTEVTTENPWIEPASKVGDVTTINVGVNSTDTASNKYEAFIRAVFD